MSLAPARRGLGFMHLEGECAPQDGPAAAEWFDRAAAQGRAGSPATLALLHEEGRLMPSDPERVKELYKKAGF